MRPAKRREEQADILVAAGLIHPMETAETREVEADTRTGMLTEATEMLKAEITVAMAMEKEMEDGIVVVVTSQIDPRESPLHDSVTDHNNKLLHLWFHKEEVPVETFRAQWICHRQTSHLQMGLHKDPLRMTTEEGEGVISLALGLDTDPPGVMRGTINGEEGKEISGTERGVHHEISAVVQEIQAICLRGNIPERRRVRRMVVVVVEGEEGTGWRVRVRDPGGVGDLCGMYVHKPRGWVLGRVFPSIVLIITELCHEAWPNSLALQWRRRAGLAHGKPDWKGRKESEIAEIQIKSNISTRLLRRHTHDFSFFLSFFLSFFRSTAMCLSTVYMQSAQPLRVRSQ
jgi:hypothetical protein